MTADEDRIIARNPCRIRGGGDEKPPEWPVLTIAQVFHLADQLAARRFRALILLATLASCAGVRRLLCADALEPLTPCLQRKWPRLEDLRLHRSRALLFAP